MTDLPAVHRLAHDLLRAESGAASESGSPADAPPDGPPDVRASEPEARRLARAAGRVLEELHRALRLMVGKGGWQTVMARGAVRAAAVHPELAAIDPSPDRAPSSQELASILGSTPDPETAARTLVAEVLGFLARLVGWRLTLSILRDLWPAVAERHDPSRLDADSAGSSPGEET